MVTLLAGCLAAERLVIGRIDDEPQVFRAVGAVAVDLVAEHLENLRPPLLLPLPCVGDLRAIGTD